MWPCPYRGWYEYPIISDLGDDCSVIPTCTNVSECSGHGTCVHIDKCLCDVGWGGKNCTNSTCEELAYCSGRICLKLLYKFGIFRK